MANDDNSVSKDNIFMDTVIIVLYIQV